MTAKFPRSRSSTRFTDSPLLVCGCAVLTGSLCAVLLLLLGTAAAYAQKHPAVWILPVSLGSLLLSSAVCGIVSGRCSRFPLLCGVCSGGAFMLLITLLSCLPLCDSYTALSLPWNIVLHIIMIGCSLTGAFLSKKRKPHPKRLFKKRRF